jgi:hypothetical protein
MAGKGQWTVQISYRNCGSCKQCNNNPDARPHGPYYQLRRRNPEDWSVQDSIYLGRHELSEGQLLIINKKFSGPATPDREEILATIA